MQLTDGAMMNGMEFGLFNLSDSSLNEPKQQRLLLAQSKVPKIKNEVASTSKRNERRCGILSELRPAALTMMSSNIEYRFGQTVQYECTV